MALTDWSSVPWNDDDLWKHADWGKSSDNSRPDPTPLVVGRRRLDDKVTYEWHLRELHAVEDEATRKVEASKSELRRLEDRALTLARTLEQERFRLNQEVDRERRLRQSAEAAVNRATTQGIPKDMWKRLMALCHPDKHGDSAEAKAVAQWLNENRK
jgi:hypothetical protein